MEKITEQELNLIFGPTENVPVVIPKTWNTNDLYQAYAHYILRHNPECWGKHNRSNHMRNYWIYKTQLIAGKNVIVEVMSFSRWKAMYLTYFTKAKERLIQEGEGLAMGIIGEIRIKRCERSFGEPQIDYYLTSKQPKIEKDGKMVASKIIYRTDEDYLRIGWSKLRRITNETIYEFIPITNKVKSGFRNMMSAANFANPNLKYIYDYYPRIDPEENRLRKERIKQKKEARNK